ncbi:MAG: hypothetical protein RL023_670 [Candidatus Parcubacteria bacterium]|jgi:hypothetical protein
MSSYTVLISERYYTKSMSFNSQYCFKQYLNSLKVLIRVRFGINDYIQPF